MAHGLSVFIVGTFSSYLYTSRTSMPVHNAKSDLKGESSGCWTSYQLLGVQSYDILTAKKSNCDYVNNASTCLNHVFLYTVFLNNYTILSCSHACTEN